MSNYHSSGPAQIHLLLCSLQPCAGHGVDHGLLDLPSSLDLPETLDSGWWGGVHDTGTHVPPPMLSVQCVTVPDSRLPQRFGRGRTSITVACCMRQRVCMEHTERV
jgi:hypothetical protein